MSEAPKSQGQKQEELKRIMQDSADRQQRNIDREEKRRRDDDDE